MFSLDFSVRMVRKHLGAAVGVIDVLAVAIVNAVVLLRKLLELL